MKIKSRVWHWLAVACGSVGLVLGMGAEGTAQTGGAINGKLEQMDMTTLTEFGRWLEAEHLQAIATRVSTGSECQIIIEDGMVKDAVPPEEKPQPRSWTKGAF